MTALALTGGGRFVMPGHGLALALNGGSPMGDEQLILAPLGVVEESAGTLPERADVLVQLSGRPHGTTGRELGGHGESVRLGYDNGALKTPCCAVRVAGYGARQITRLTKGQP